MHPKIHCCLLSDKNETAIRGENCLDWGKPKVREWNDKKWQKIEDVSLIARCCFTVVRVLQSCEVHTFRVAKWKILQCLIIFLKTLNFDRVMVKCIPHQDILFEAMFFTDFHSNCSVHKQATTSRIFIHNVHTKSLLHVIRGGPAITKLLCKRYLQLLLLKAWLTTIFVHKMLYVKITNCILGFTIKNRDSAHKLTNCQDVGGDAN